MMSKILITEKKLVHGHHLILIKRVLVRDLIEPEENVLWLFRLYLHLLIFLFLEFLLLKFIRFVYFLLQELAIVVILLQRLIVHLKVIRFKQLN